LSDDFCFFIATLKSVVKHISEVSSSTSWVWGLATSTTDLITSSESKGNNGM